VRSRKVEEVNGEIEQAHYSAALCHLGNASYRLGKAVPFSTNPPGMDNPQIAESWNTLKANVADIGVDLDKATYQLGPELDFDPKTEQFIDNDAANRLITREYREPFVVPKEV